MSFKARQLAGIVLVISLFIQMQISTMSYAAPPAKIAFTSTRGGNFEIYAMDSNGANQVRLTDDPAYDVEPSWSPEGDRIAFVSARDKRSLNIYVMDFDGQNLMQLTKESSNTEPAWSPDGTKIAFIRAKRGTHVWVMDADGGNQMQLTHLGSNYNPAWSPDGVRIAFVDTDRQGGSEIYAMDSDGNNQLRLTHDLEEKDNPSWSPDGQWIAFDSYRSRAYQIYVVNTDGSGLTRRLTRRRPHNWKPACSSDGDTIAYSLWEWGISMTINLMTPDGMHLKQLTEDDGTFRSDVDWFDPVGRSVSPAANFVTIWGEIKRPTAGR